MNRNVRKLTKLAAAYRAAEEAIVHAFFAKPRGKQDHLRWLRAQAFKEYSAIKPIFTALAKLYPEIDRGIDRHDYEELTEKLADETKHARLVMDLLEDISGKKITIKDLLWLPARQKTRENSRALLAELRNTLTWLGNHQRQRNSPPRRESRARRHHAHRRRRRRALSSLQRAKNIRRRRQNRQSLLRHPARRGRPQRQRRPRTCAAGEDSGRFRPRRENHLRSIRSTAAHAQ